MRHQVEDPRRGSGGQTWILEIGVLEEASGIGNGRRVIRLLWDSPLVQSPIDLVAPKILDQDKLSS